MRAGRRRRTGLSVHLHTHDERHCIHRDEGAVVQSCLENLGGRRRAGLAASAMATPPRTHSRGVIPSTAAGVKPQSCKVSADPRNRKCGEEAFFGCTSIFIWGMPGMLILNFGESTRKKAFRPAGQACARQQYQAQIAALAS